jgi:hypothetical protein
MAWPDELGPFGTKRRCGISLCICIFSDFIILAIYWSRIGEALQNPVVAIIKSLEKDYPREQAETIQSYDNGSAIILQQNNSSSPKPWWDAAENPSVGRIIYHFAGALSYIGYTLMNTIIILNTIIRLCYMDRNLSWNPPKYKILQPFIFDMKGKMARWYCVTVLLLHLIICMDDILISHAVGYKLPFNELFLEIVRQITMLIYKAIGHVINSLFFVFFLLVSAMIIMSVKMTIIITCLDDFFGGPKIYVQQSPGSTASSRGTATQSTAMAVRSQLGSSNGESAREEETSVRLAFVSPASKHDDLPPSYENEVLPPTYAEALVLASIEMPEIHSGSEQKK